MKCDRCVGEYREAEVSYTLFYEGKFHIIEHVPARVCSQCGERLYTPETVKKVQAAIWQHRKPDRIVETPVIDFVLIA